MSNQFSRRQFLQAGGGFVAAVAASSTPWNQITSALAQPIPPTTGTRNTFYYPIGVKYRGINRAGGEYGEDWGGWTGQTFYTIPTGSALSAELAFYRSKGFNTLRFPISWERLQHELYGDLDPSYTEQVTSFVNEADLSGFSVIVDLHNYNRYATGAFDEKGVQKTDGSYTKHIFGDGFLNTSHLVNVWTRLANLFLEKANVVLNLMNEPHDFPVTSDVWFSNIQTVINAIRSTGAGHLILVPNSRGSDVEHWDAYSPNGGKLDSIAALAIADPLDNFAFDMHAYQDDPSSATSYADLIRPVTAWAKSHGRRLFLSELGVIDSSAHGGPALANLLEYLNDNSDVWLGWTPWNLPPYSLTPEGRYTEDGPQMAWYSPYLTPNWSFD